MANPTPGRGDEIPTVDLEVEPEAVGAFSSIVGPECSAWIGETPDEMERCGADATHSVVLYSGTLHVLARCDEHGRPDDAAEDRTWSGEHVDELRVAGPMTVGNREVAGRVAAEDCEQEMYRVEDSSGHYVGHAGGEERAKRMAEECVEHDPSAAPHQVRRLPEKDVHLNGSGTYPIVYRTDDDSEVEA